MSKNPIITEGTQGRTFNAVAKLGFPLIGGGESLWVPKDERQLETLSVEANGTYRPKEKYGISRVSVSVPGTTSKLSGKGSDGNDYTVDLDSNDNIVETMVPSSIAITTEPTTLSYTDGDTIDFTGLVVKAYDGNGNLFTGGGYTGGVVPNSELQFPVTVAVYDGSGAGEDSHIVPSGFSDIQQYNPIPTGTECRIYYGDGANYDAYTVEQPYSVMTCYEALPGSVLMIYAGTERPSLGNWRSFTYDEKTVYYWPRSVAYGAGVHHIYGPDVGRGQIVSEGSNYQTFENHIAWTMIYGEPSGGTSSQTIPVNWPRYNDGKILSDSFDITVSPSPSNSGNNSGGNGGTTVDDDGFSGHDGNF